MKKVFIYSLVFCATLPLIVGCSNEPKPMMSKQTKEEFSKSAAQKMKGDNSKYQYSEETTNEVNSFKSAMMKKAVNSYNEENGTNFKTLQEIQAYEASK